MESRHNTTQDQPIVNVTDDTSNALLRMRTLAPPVCAAADSPTANSGRGMMNARRSIRGSWCGMAILVAFAVMLAVCIAPALASAGNAPNITSWSNDKTNDMLFNITVNISENVNFNATANQTINTWSWYDGGANQSHNYNNITLSWSSSGVKTVIVNATNTTNGTSDPVQWNVTVNPVTWWNSSWNYYKQLTINHTYVNSSQTDFPMMINITDTELALKAQQDGDDIVFVNSDNTIQLDHQIEGTFNSTNGHLKAWIRIPTLSNTTDTVINMYYGNSGATNTENPGGVWGVNASGIWLMDEGTGDDVNDSSGNGNHGVNHGADWVAGGLDFNNGTSDYMEVSAFSPDMVTTKPYTIAYRLNTTQTAGTWDARHVFIKDGSDGFGVAPNETGKVFIYTSGGHTMAEAAAGTAINDGQLHSIAAVFDQVNKIVSVYVDGILDYQVTSYTDNSSTTNAKLYVGCNDAYAANYDGIFEYIHIYDRALSAAEIGTRYNNTNSPSTFSTVGAEQSQAPAGEPDIISHGPTSPVNNIAGATRAFNITVNQTVDVTWYINGTNVSTDTGVTTATYTNTSAAVGVWNVSAAVANGNGDDIETWIWNVTAAPAGEPDIISHGPTSPVNNIAGATRAFNITVNQTVDVTWYINGTNVSTDTGVTTATYTNTSAAVGVWNVSAAVANGNGDDIETWIWNVTAAPAGEPDIISHGPTSPVNNIAGATRAFNITVNQTVDVTWYINGTNVSTDTGVTTATYTNTSAAVGVWNVSAAVANGNGDDIETWIWNVTAAPAGEPDIISHGPTSPVNNIAGATRAFNITVNQTVDVTWYINGTNVSTDTGVTTATYTNTSAAVGVWNVSAAVANGNGDDIETWIWNVTAAPAGEPDIISHGPTSPVNNIAGATRAFNITVNQTVDVTWYINGTNVSTDTGVTTATYTNTSAAVGVWNVSAAVANGNGDDIETWIWNVTAAPAGEPDIISHGPTSPVNNIAGATRAFNITVNQTVDVTWYINGTNVSTDTGVTTATYTNTSAAVGVWNVSAAVANGNGDDIETWIWNVTAAPAGEPDIISHGPTSPVNNIAGATRAFNITVNQTVDVTWYINGTNVSTDTGVTTATYTNTSAAVGVWNVSAAVANGNGDDIETWIWNVTAAPAGEPDIISHGPTSPVNNIAGATRAFNITVNQTVDVTWYINGTNVSTDTGVTTATYTNTSAAVGVWNVSAAVANGNGDDIETWIWNVTAAPAGEPDIISHGPTSPVNNIAGATRAFNITVNQTVDVTWYINGTNVSTDTGVTTATYTNTSAAVGVWNVSAAVANGNGDDIETWIWNVTAAPAGEPDIISHGPTSPVNNIAGATRAFNITVNQTVDVTWYINGTNVSTDTGVTTATYTNTSAAVGVWNVSAAVANGNGDDIETWIWNVTAAPAGEPDIISHGPTSPVNNIAGATRAFNITVNQTVDVTWYINGTNVSTDTGVTTATYTNTSAAVGVWNVSAAVANGNGDDIETWIWNVTAAPAGEPDIISHGPTSPVNNIAGATRAFNITVNQTVDVTWYINGTNVSTDTGVTTATYTNTSAAVGVWNVSAAVANGNGDDIETWIWNVTAGPVTRIVVTPTSTSLNVSSGTLTEVFTATGYDQYNNTKSGLNFTWASSDTYAGTIVWTSTTTGTFTAGHVGTSDITASNGTTTSYPVPVTVNAGSNNTTVTNEKTFTATSGDDVTVTGSFTINVTGWVNATAIGNATNSSEVNQSKPRSGLGSGDEVVSGVIVNVSGNITDELATGNGSTIRIRICYNATTLTALGIDASTLAIWKYDDNVTEKWVKQSSTRSGTCVYADVKHLCTFGLVGSKATPSSSTGGGGGGTYPPGWFGTPTPTVTATKAPTGTATDAPSGERVTPTPAKRPDATKTTTPTATETAKTDTPGLTAVFAIAGLLAVAYAMMRRRE